MAKTVPPSWPHPLPGAARPFLRLPGPFVGTQVGSRRVCLVGHPLTLRWRCAAAVTVHVQGWLGGRWQDREGWHAADGACTVSTLLPLPLRLVVRVPAGQTVDGVVEVIEG